jgi:hypothetical protein
MIELAERLKSLIKELPPFGVASRYVAVFKASPPV